MDVEEQVEIERRQYSANLAGHLVQSISAKKVAKPKTNCNSNESYTKSCEILCSITYSKSAKIELLELTVFLFF